MNVTSASLQISAEYARLADPFICRNEARYYLGGFYVQAAHASGGAIIVATDGHTMAVFYDKAGQVKAPGIIRISKTTLAACRRSRSEDAQRVLVVDGHRVSVYRDWNQEIGSRQLVA